MRTDARCGGQTEERSFNAEPPGYFRCLSSTLNLLATSAPCIEATPVTSFVVAVSRRGSGVGNLWQNSELFELTVTLSTSFQVLFFNFVELRKINQAPLLFVFTGEDVAEWEKELQQELQDYEMVGGAGDLDDADLEREILQQIEEETQALS
ncbi:hypothetical protein BaRGS_00008651 [Batillaria attramentaria]|uniref:Uncharacterized protein n=1 Tax=Batillaria attramentaria TaxID=370345 RepID=A0ABD0LKP6_9CAEN